MITTKSLVPNQINMVRLSDYLQFLEGSVDIQADHDDLIVEIVKDKVLDNCMGAIIESIMEYGFIAPIGLMLIECEYSGRTIPKQGNGHHRLVAAILLGIDTIPIYPTITGSEWEIDFDNTGDQESNKYFGHGIVTREGVRAGDNWSAALNEIYREY